MQKTLTWTPEWNIFETGSSFSYRDIEIESFPIPHDAQDPVGFRFTSGLDDLFSPRRTLTWVTDLGHAPQNVRERIRESDVLVVEANHCPRMLEADPKMRAEYDEFRRAVADAANRCPGSDPRPRHRSAESSRE